MDKATQGYRDHDFSKDANWTTYLDNMYPTPPHSKLEHFRRKYYQRIDPAFDVSFDAPSQQSPPPPSAPPAPPQ